MNMPPQRIAFVAIVAVLLACGGAGWWLRGAASPSPPFASKDPVPRQVPPVTRPATHDETNEASEHDGPGSAVEPCEQAMRQQRRRRMEALAKADDTDSRIAGALLAMSPANGPAEDGMGNGLSMLKAAAQAAPGDAEAAWYYARYCANDGDCDATEATAALVALEPDNLDGWLLALQLAQKRGDEAGVARAMEGGAKARYFDQRSGDSFMRATRALADLPVPPACTTPEFAEFLRDIWRLERQPRMQDLAMV